MPETLIFATLSVVVIVTANYVTKNVTVRLAFGRTATKRMIQATQTIVCVVIAWIVPATYYASTGRSANNPWLLYIFGLAILIIASQFCLKPVLEDGWAGIKPISTEEWQAKRQARDDRRAGRAANKTVKPSTANDNFVFNSEYLTDVDALLEDVA